MRQSQLFGKTLREAPKDAVAANAIWLSRGGFADRLMSGVYSFRPLGFRVLKKIENIIRLELEKIGAQEVSMPILHPAHIWEKTGRFHEIGKELWRIKSREGEDIVLSMTHEEAIAETASHFIQTYHDLPRLLNQFQIKIRDEERPRGGLLRLKEFIMQDAYSFDRNEEELDRTYKKIFQAYLAIFKRFNLKVIPVDASSGIMGGNESHEFMLVSEAGEDRIALCTQCSFAANIEVLKKGVKACPKCRGSLEEKRSIELGHTFKLGTKYSQPFDMYFEDQDGKKKLVIMGSYGIGLDRTMASVVEAHHDDRGILWPEAVAPFQVHLIELLGKNKKAQIKKSAEKLYGAFLAKGIEVLYDDRDEKTAGEKFADADLIGIPWRAVVSEKTFQQRKIEVKMRRDQKVKLITEQDFYRIFNFKNLPSRQIQGLRRA